MDQIYHHYKGANTEVLLGHGKTMEYRSITGAWLHSYGVLGHMNVITNQITNPFTNGLRPVIYY